MKSVLFSTCTDLLNVLITCLDPNNLLKSIHKFLNSLNSHFY